MFKETLKIHYEAFEEQSPLGGFLFRYRKPGPLGLRLVDPTARRARSETIGFANFSKGDAK
jgi:hypothetical protein